MHAYARMVAVPALLGVVVVFGTLMVGCSGGDPGVPTEPLFAVQASRLSPGERVDAIESLSRQVESGEVSQAVMRHALTELAWDLGTPESVRAAALEAILWDPDGQEASRALTVAMLPTEPSRGCVAIMSTASADQGWVEATPALVRSLARTVPGVEDSDRVEARALGILHPGERVERVAFEVFLDPGIEPGPAGLELDTRTREAAWEVVGRFAPDDQAAVHLLEFGETDDEIGGTMLANLRELARSFGVTPNRAEEMRWAMRLVEEREDRLAAWWRQAEQGASSTPGNVGETRELRHLEPIRWAGRHRPAWLGSDRAGLLEEMLGRMRGRQIYPRTEGVDGGRRADEERLASVSDGLVWGDLLALLVVDEALEDPGVRAALLQGAETDNGDRNSEHGGTIWADASGFHVQAFVPRSVGSPNDRRFVAPREMIDFSSAALVHFHYHVTKWRNRDASGPSDEDLAYAATFGRTCVVLTGIGPGVLNADVYFPTGVIVDLGEVRVSGEGR